MQTAAGISQGTSLQVLGRLVERQLVRVSAEGPRGRKDFALTSAGKHWLTRRYASLADAPPMGDLDSTLRKALLVAFINQDPGQASRILRSAVTERLSRPQDISNGPAGAADMAQVYMRLREAHATALLNTEVDVLRRVAKELARRSKH